MHSSITRTARRALAAGLTMAAVSGAALAAAAPASAAVQGSKNGLCEYPELCLYYNYDYVGPVFDLYSPDAKFGNDGYPLSPSISPNNNSRSWWNNDYVTWYVYKKANYAGLAKTLTPGSFGNFTGNWVDNISSANYL